ncbi:hypothetical protein D9Q98_004254 [Chlorella vulgaris]|uniref:Uncharacterized protein n=1 Tax=Chlorella vulgaris TaxID=3077 RepID=A0A9D4TRD6_CHLVU|nr:hypothetical protein D9Q98_004254 [Chlorella vulgaris]
MSNSISQRVAQLRDRNVFTQSAAARDLRDLASDPSQRQRIAAAGAIPALVELLASSCAAVQEAAAEALERLAADACQQIAIAAAGAIPALLQLLEGSSSWTVHSTAAAVLLLSRLCSNNKSNQQAAAGATPALVRLAGSFIPEVRTAAASALGALADGSPETTSPLGQGATTRTAGVLAQSAPAGSRVVTPPAPAFGTGASASSPLAAPTSSPAFGAASGPACDACDFGASSSSLLGAPTSSPAFVAAIASAFGAFSFGASASSPFGAPTSCPAFVAASAPAFGAFGFGGSASSPFGAPTSSPAFVAASAPAFGAFGFGASASSPFGAPTSSPAFVAASAPAFGAFSFGASASSPFDAPTSSPAFGAASAPAFGAFGFGGSASSPFRALNSSPAFVASGAPAFGAFGFGASASPAFGASTSGPAFVAASAPAFGASGTGSDGWMADSRVVPALVLQLGCDDEAKQRTAAAHLATLAKNNAANQAAIVAGGAIVALVRLLSSGIADSVQEAAADALGALAADDPENQQAIVAADAIPRLRQLQDTEDKDSHSRKVRIVHSAVAKTLKLLQDRGNHQQAWQIRYEELRLEREIGRGSFGTVHLADWRATPVAVKQLNELLGTGSQSSPVLAALRRESDIMRRLSHPNCVLLMGVCTSPPAVITEYCERGCLMDVLHEAATDAAAASQLTWPCRLSMALDAARGMHYLHSHSPPIIHRDLKSPNLLVTRGWQVKVADFNLSRVVESMHSKMTMVTQPRWLAPEVMDGGQSTTASDVYAFGVVLWELLTWKEPWHDVTNPAQIMVKVLVHQKRPEVPAIEAVPGADTPQVTGMVDGFVALMRRCWDQDPSARPAFKTVAEQLSQLEASARAAAGSGLGAGPTPDGGASSSARVRGCPICYEEFSVGDMICLVPCGHGPICGGCTDKIAQRSNDCPICKTKTAGHVPATFRMFSC